MAESPRERYRLERKISDKGSFSDVWLATDTLLDRPVAIKCPKTTDDPIRRERALVEARMLARLNHPNITQIYDAFFDEEEGNLYLVIEYVDGKDLSDIIGQGTPLSLDIIIEITIGILRALSYAHQQGLVHRDIKAANVMIGDDVKLTDFGLATLRSILGRGTGFVAGTPAYMAPEQVEGRVIDGRADLYALGVLLFEMITGGRLPFEHADETEMLNAHLHINPPPVSQFAPAVPPQLEQLVSRLLAKDPEDRYPSAEAVMDALDVVQVGPTVGNLPAQLTLFVGREEELAAIQERLQDPDCRLLTLVGIGGSGKTRLALEVATTQIENYSHGVYFVSLAPLDSVDSIVPTVAEALGFRFYEEGEPQQQLLDYLRQKRALIILDNFEHLVEGAGLVTDILQTAPDVKILATSRARLNVGGENLIPVAGMSVPDQGIDADTAGYSAIKLYVQSARRVHPSYDPTADDMADVVRVCRLLEGMPLAILLATAWMEILSPAEIAVEISQSLDFLETDLRDLPERQRSMRAVFDHSWELLTEREKELFQGLSVFRGGFARDAAQKVTDASLHDLMALVNKSLLQRMSRGRYEMHELLRGYAAEKLDGSPAAGEAARDRHSAYYSAAFQRWGEDLKGPLQQAALAKMDAEIENGQAAWNWAVKQEQVERLDQASDGLCRFYVQRARYQEGEVACQIVVEKLARAGDGMPLEYRLRVLAKMLSWQSVFNQALGHTKKAAQIIQQSLALLERPELADQDTRLETASALLQMGHLLTLVGRWGEARDSYQQALEQAEVLGDASVQAWCQTAIGELVGWKQGQYAEGSAWLEQARAGFEELGDIAGVAQVQKIGGTLAARQGDYEVARARYEESLTIRRELEDKSGVADLLNNLGIVARFRGDSVLACSIHEEALAIRREIGDKLAIAVSLNNLGNVALDQADYATARARLEEALAIQREVGDREYIANALNNLGNVARAQGDCKEARSLYQESLTINRDLGDRWAIAYLLEDIGCLATLEQQSERALRLSAAAETVREAIGAPLSPAEKEKLRAMLEPVQQALGETVAAAVEAEGKAMSLEEAIDYALQKA